MESYGEILKEAREAKHLDIDTAARETSITVEYLNGLEAEDNSAFPGEPYMIGFLRNYAEYLGVNTETVLTLYHNKQIQEAPVPEGLIVKQKPAFFMPLIIGLSAFIVIIITAVCIIVSVHRRNAESEDVAVQKGMAVKKYQLTATPFTGRVYRGDQVIVPSAKGNIILTVGDTLSSIGLETPVGVIYTDLAEESEIDIDGDTLPDIIVYVSDISSTDESRGAEVRMMLKDNSATAPASAAEEIEETEPAVVTATGTPADASKHKPFVILEDNRAYPFTINASFRGPCVFRYRADRKPSEENYFSNGDLVTMTSNNGTRVWMSNCNTVKLTVIADARSFDLEIGKAGQVLVEDIKWVKNLDGRYQLVVVELD